MNENDGPVSGTISWYDLTVPDAERVRDFYARVVGWEFKPVSMGDYNDYCMQPQGRKETVAGVCHARGTNANLPPQWLIYINVKDAEASARECERLGGRIVDGPRLMGNSMFCVIQDPAGAVAALISTHPKTT